MDIEKALALLAAVGSDQAPTLAELTEAKDAFIAAAKEAKTQGDKVALASLLETIKASKLAIEEAEKLEAEKAAELDALAAEFPELADATEEPEPSTEELQAEAPRVLSAAEAVQRLGLVATPRQEAPVTDEPTQTLTINGEDKQDATWADLSQAFAKNTKSALRSGRSTIATFRTEYAHNLTGKAAENTRIIDDLAESASDPAIVAAGGCCSLAEPIRDQPMLASLARPIADSLPTIGATAGAVTFFPPICLPQTGVGTWTCDQDEAVDADDESTWKECTEIECADAETVSLDAIYRCLTIGNFQQRFAPERWDAILRATAAQQARMAEVALFNQIANSDYTTEHTATETGSIFTTFTQAVILAAATIRQNQRYEGSIIRVIAPSWVKDAIEADRIARAVARGRVVEGSNVDTLLGERSIQVTWSPDIDPIEPNGQADGPLTQYPENANVVLYVDGGVFRLDGGELNLGTEIRDHDLNRQNKLAAFSESFESAFVRSCDSKAITIPVTVCNQSPCATAVDEG